MKNRLDIIHWLKSDAPIEEGIRLFSLCTHIDHPFIGLIKHNPEVCHGILIRELASRASINLKTLTASSTDHVVKRKKFRDEWPFLQDINCPAELKILATNKITAYHNYVAAHARLFDCSSQEENFLTVKDLVENYIENRLILREFEYYNEHNNCLGKHPIFQEFEDLKQLRKMSPVALMSKKEKLEHNIWRIKKEIELNNKPHLKINREKSLQKKQNELNEVNRLLEDYS